MTNYLFPKVARRINTGKPVWVSWSGVAILFSQLMRVGGNEGGIHWEVKYQVQRIG